MRKPLDTPERGAKFRSRENSNSLNKGEEKMVGSMTGEQVREFKEILKGHLGEIASALEFEAGKHPADIDVERLEELKSMLEKVIQGVKIFQDGLYC